MDTAMLVGNDIVELGLDRLVLSIPYPKKLVDSLLNPITAERVAQFESEKSEFVSAMHYIKNMVIDNFKHHVTKTNNKDQKRYHIFFDDGGLMCVFTLGFCFGTGVINLEVNPSRLTQKQWEEFVGYTDVFFNLGYHELYTKAVVSHAEFYVDVAGEDLSNLVLLDNSRRTTTHYEGTTYIGKRGAPNITTMYDKAREQKIEGKLVRVEARINRRDIRLQDLVESDLFNPLDNILVLNVNQVQLVAQEFGKPEYANLIKEFGLVGSGLDKTIRKKMLLQLQENTVPWWQPELFWGAHRDNISVNVTEAVSQWFGSSLNKRSLELAAMEVARICATDNWYAQPDGRFYIFGWEKAEFEPKQGLPKTYPELLTFFTDAIAERRDVDAMKAFNRILSDRAFRPRDFATLLLDLAKDSTSQQAHRLIEIYTKNASALWLDGNISGQAVFALLNGDFGYQTSPIVDEAHVMKLLAEAEHKISDGLVIPDYARDGIHTRQSGDRRFAGTVKQMAGCCRAYEYYGRLSPTDEWLGQFYEPQS